MWRRAISSTSPQHYRELTWAAVLLGLIQGCVLNIAFVYIALKLGFSIGGSAVSSIIGYVVLNGLLHRGSMVENNINQTIASAINSSGTGVVFVLPALFILNAQHPELKLSLWPLLAAGVAGSILGVSLIIPLRRQLIEIERLRFPTGVAIASIIRSTNAGRSKTLFLVLGFGLSAIWKMLLLSGVLASPGLLEEDRLNLSFGLLPDYLLLALYLSPISFAAGLLTGRAGLPLFIGGLVAWWVIAPSAVNLNWLPTPLPENFSVHTFLHQQMLRPLGIGILIGAACTELLVKLPLLRSALATLLSARKAQQGLDNRQQAEDLPGWILLWALVIACLFFFVAAWASPEMSFIKALFIAILGVVWMGLAALVVTQSTGLTDVSPISGMALISVTMMMLVLQSNVAVSLMLTIAVSIAIGQAADMMQDLKTGFLLGSRPLLQQMAQLLSAWLGVILAFAVLYILWSSGPGNSHGFGPGTSLPAPQADAISNIVTAVQTGSVPADKFILGGLIGLLLGAAPFSGLGILVGLAMYLAFEVTLGYGLGCLTHVWFLNRKGENFIEQRIVPLAAGLIIGDALMSVGFALYQVLLAGV